MEYCYLLIFSGFFASCKKERLTGETGNLEFIKSQDLIGYPLYYELYNEQQYYLYLSNHLALRIKSESTSAGTFSIKGLRSKC
jgi:hypothetical protein